MKTCLDCGRVADGSRGTRCKKCQARVRRPYNGTTYRSTQPGPACTCCGATDDLTHDHIIPLRHGGAGGPLRTLCRPCNSSASRHPDNECRLEHSGRITLVCGPPCAGKTTWCTQQNGTVLDQDEMTYQDFSRAISALIAKRHCGPVYVIRCLPGAQARERYAALIHADRIVLLDPGQLEATRRAAARPNPRQAIAAVRAWYAREH